VTLLHGAPRARSIPHLALQQTPVGTRPVRAFARSHFSRAPASGQPPLLERVSPPSRERGRPGLSRCERRAGARYARFCRPRSLPASVMQATIERRGAALRRPVRPRRPRGATSGALERWPDQLVALMGLGKYRLSAGPTTRRRNGPSPAGRSRSFRGRPPRTTICANPRGPRPSGRGPRRSARGGRPRRPQEDTSLRTLDAIVSRTGRASRNGPRLIPTLMAMHRGHGPHATTSGPDCDQILSHGEHHRARQSRFPPSRFPA